MEPKNATPEYDVCGDCGYYGAVNEGQGFCYCNPPVPVMVPVRGPATIMTSGQNAQTQTGIATLRPPVKINERGCAYFSPKFEDSETGTMNEFGMTKHPKS